MCSCKPEFDGDLYFLQCIFFGHTKGGAPRKFGDDGNKALIFIAVEDLDCVFIDRCLWILFPE